MFRAYGVLYYRRVKRYCPICRNGSGKAFLGFGGFAGAKKSRDCACACCGCHNRHRFHWLVLEEQLFRQENLGCSLLHFAPESFFLKRLEDFFGDNYVTGDIEPGRAKYVVDITDICFPENKFEYIICNHILEHIVDDIAALKELYRVLKPMGTAYLSVPLRREETTYEDYSITSFEERTAIFGRYDHVRHYGTDIIDRIKSVGFDVEVKVPSDIVACKNLRETLGLHSDSDKFYIARKPTI
jgi:SAM-dependent methyltransferase